MNPQALSLAFFVIYSFLFLGLFFVVAWYAPEA